VPGVVFSDEWPTIAVFSHPTPSWNGINWGRVYRRVARPATVLGAAAMVAVHSLPPAAEVVDHAHEIATEVAVFAHDFGGYAKNVHADLHHYLEATGTALSTAFSNDWMSNFLNGRYR